MATSRRRKSEKEVVNVSLHTTVAKDADSSETFVPLASIDRRNGRSTIMGMWRKRPGQVLEANLGLEAVGYGVIPYEKGLAVYADGTIYDIAKSSLIGQVKMAQRPRWVVHDNVLLIATGGDIQRYSLINGLRKLVTDPPRAKYLSVLNGMVIASGFDRTTFQWTTPGSHTSWPALSSTTIEDTSDYIREQRVLNNRLLLFTDHTVETWQNTGGTAVFTRSSISPKGILASDSLVQIHDTLAWLGDDAMFYAMEGSGVTPISLSMQRELKSLAVPEDCYGMHLRAESVVAWVFPSDGRCFVYDYVRKSWSEDNEWARGCWQLPPYGAYGEVGTKRYMLDRAATGKLFTRSDDAYDDDGTPIRVLRKFRVRLNAEGHLGRISKGQFRVTRGQQDPNSEHPPKFLVRWRLDNGPWSDTEELSIGNEEDHSPYVPLEPIGVAREIEFEVVETDAVKWLVTDLMLTVRGLGR